MFEIGAVYKLTQDGGTVGRTVLQSTGTQNVFDVSVLIVPDYKDADEVTYSKGPVSMGTVGLVGVGKAILYDRATLLATADWDTLFWGPTDMGDVVMQMTHDNGRYDAVGASSPSHLEVQGDVAAGQTSWDIWLWPNIFPQNEVIVGGKTAAHTTDWSASRTHLKAITAQSVGLFVTTVWSAPGS